MSIKLYNGYRLPKMNLSQIVEFCRPIREKLSEMKTELYTERVAIDVAHYIDNICVGDIKLKPEELEEGSRFPKNILYKMCDKNDEKMKKSRNTNSREPSLDFEFTASFIPSRGCTLVMIFCEQSEFVSYWESLPGVESYYYQDSTDKPNDVSEKAWSKRYRDWDKALNGFGSAAENGVSFTFCEWRLPYFLNRENVLKNMPSFEDRLLRVANNKFRNDYIDAEMAELKSIRAADYELKTTDYTHSIFNAQDAARTDGGKAEVAKLAIGLESLLIKEITIDYL